MQMCLRGEGGYGLVQMCLRGEEGRWEPNREERATQHKDREEVVQRYFKVSVV